MSAIFLDRATLAWAGALVHFVWQGLALWAVTELVIRPARWKSAEARCHFYAGLLVVLAAAPVVTFAVAMTERAPTTWTSVTVLHPSGPGAHSPQPPQAQTRIVPYLPPDSRSRTLLHEYRMPLVGLWLGGATVMMLRLASGAVAVWRLTRDRRPLPETLAKIVAPLAERLGFKTLPIVMVVERLTQAVAVGVLKPMVLLPAVWACELSPAVLEAVIAHELSHLKRWDLVVNFVQRLVGALLFFHPVVWWCSRRLRVEREMCCDLLATRVMGNDLAYVDALTHLAERQLPAREPILAAGMSGEKMVLLDRVRNVLGLGPKEHRRWGRLLAALLVAVALVTLGVVILRSTPNRMRMPPVSHTVPNEKDRASLPTYVIEPPDILVIEAVRLVPKPPYHIRSADVLNVEVEGGPQPFSGRFIVDVDGRIDLGPTIGKASVGGLTVDDATQAIAKSAAEVGLNPLVSVSLYQSSAMQPIAGEHLVAPDGTVNLGTYGIVYVAGMTLKEAIEAQLARYLDAPQVSVSVFAYNSKLYYVILRGSAGDSVSSMPITGGETVLDAIAKISGLTGLGNKDIWISRPANSGKVDQVLPVDWKAITYEASKTANYQVFPGDRIFIAEPPSLWDWLGAFIP